MNPLKSRLAALRRRLRLVTLVRGVGVIATVLLGVALVAGLLDWALHLPAAVRALLLLATVGGTVAAGWWFLSPLWVHTDDLSLALRVEAAYPVLNDALASTVQFLDQPEASPAAGSPALRREAVHRALRMAQGVDFNRVIDVRGFWGSGAAAAGFLAVGVGLALLAPETFTAAALRLAHPFGEHEWPRATALTLEFPRRIATGQLFVIEGEVGRVVPANAEVEFDGLRSVRERRVYPIQKNEAGTAGTFVAKVETTDQYRGFRFRVRVNDAASPSREDRWHAVEVGTPPVLVALDGLPSPQVTLDYPAYTELPSPERLSPGTGHVEAVAGTWIDLRAATDRPIARAWVEYRPQLRDALGLQLTEVGTAGHPSALAALALLTGAGRALDPVPATVDPSGLRFGVRFRPWVSGTYVVHIEDADRLAKGYEFGLQVLPDPPPDVNIQRPASNRSLLPSATLSLKVTAEDETFALRSAYLEFRRKDEQGRYLDPQPRRLPLYDGPAVEALADGLARGLSGLPGGLTPPAVKLRPKGLTLERRWSLRGLVREGDVLVIRACAEDFNDLDPFRTPGRSHEVELRIVSESKFEGILDQEQKKVQQTLLRLREWQDQALKNVIEAEQQWRNAGKVGEDEMKLLREAEQLQKQIQARVGEKEDEGLRGEIAQLQDVLKDNKVRSSGAKDRVAVLKNELDRLAREHLQQITPKLSDARQEMDGQKDPRKPEPNEKGELGEAREGQEEVRQTLDDLLEYLDRWSSQEEIRGEARKILDEQRKVQQRTEKLNEPYTPDNPEWQAEKERVAALQRELAKKSQALLEKMERVSQEKSLKEPEAADMLEQSAKVGRDMMLPQEMQDTADNQLKHNQLNRAGQQQGESIKTLEKMVQELREERADEVERLIKKQKEADRQVDDLVERLEKLQKKVEEANKLADPAKKEQELKKLAAEQRRLEDEARQQARELAQLRADEASQRLRQAADKMGQAAQDLDGGANPAEAQQEAMERLEQAQAQLEQAERRAQEELAREELAKIADQIKGLKERQEAAVGETERLHKEMLRAGWGRGLTVSLWSHAESQDGLGQETRSMADKLKGAKVFEMILTKSAANMGEAAEALRQRQQKIIDANRLGRPLEPEELQDEEQTQQHTLDLQNRARRRLERLLEALEQELDNLDKKAEAEKKQGDQPTGEGEQPQGGIQAQDGIPAVAQLKALREEQMDVNERTRAFAEAHPDANNLTERDRAELQAIHDDQDAVFQLFREMVTTANQAGNEGDNP